MSEKAKKTHWVNVEKIQQLLEVLPQLDGLKADLTIRVSIEELQKLPPEKCKAFLDGIAAIVATQAIATMENANNGSG
jgi:hypothetical protein